VSARALTLLVAVVLALGTAACGGDDSNGGEASATTAQTKATTARTETTKTATAETASATPETAASPASGGTVRPVDRLLFRIRDNAVFCGLKRSGGRDLLVCWATRSGYTVRLTPRGGRPSGEIVRRNRGIPPNAGAVRVLRNGQGLRRGAFRCNVRKNVVRCRNAARHGFQLGKTLAFRF
jgi:hypothetical protein